MIAWMRSMAYFSAGVLAALFVAAEPAHGQCDFFTVAAIAGSCEGSINASCPSNVDSMVWSDGHVDFTQHGPVGSYGYEVYAGGSVIASGTRPIPSASWTFADIGTLWSSLGHFWLEGSVSMNYCNSVYYAPCCQPEFGETQISAIQDGLVEITSPCTGCTPGCIGGSFLFSDLPPGHQYCLRLTDPVCGITIDLTDQCFVANSCAHLQLNTQISGSVPGENSGVIELLEAIPDTTEPYPIYSPVLGLARLWIGLDWFNYVEQYNNVGSASWNGLDTGYYVLEFAPDAGCQTRFDTLYVQAESNTDLLPGLSRPTLNVRPTVTDEFLLISSSARTTLLQARIIDIHGRIVSTIAMPPGSLSVEGLAPGPYILAVEQGGSMLRSRFIKR